MISLASLLADVITTLQLNTLFQRVWVVQTDVFAADQFAFKVRAEISAGYVFQMRIYYNRGHCDYAYQLFRDVPVLRWDNKEHFTGLPTSPHHYYNEHGLPEISPLQGDPRKDLPIVLEQLGRSLAQKNSPEQGANS